MTATRTAYAVADPFTEREINGELRRPVTSLPPRAPSYDELAATVLRWHAATPRLCAALWSASAFAERRAAEEALRKVAGRLLPLGETAGVARTEETR